MDLIEINEKIVKICFIACVISFGVSLTQPITVRDAASPDTIAISCARNMFIVQTHLYHNLKSIPGPAGDNCFFKAGGRLSR